MNCSRRTKASDLPPIWVPPPVLAAAVLAVGLLLDWQVPVFVLTIVLTFTLRLCVGAVLIVAGVALLVAAERRFHHAGTPVPPWQATRALVTDGIYRFVRNPIYVGLVAAMAGLAVALAGDWLLLLQVPMGLVLHYGVVLPEERYLEEKFGRAWHDYAARVPRYGWPDH
jgi:protein-S-isoprenylcysteine O-methyltransferase Ste14